MRYFLVFTALLTACLAVGPHPPKIRPNGLETYQPDAQFDGEDFASWVTAQVGSGKKELAVAKGAYHVIPGSNQDGHVQLLNLDGVTIWMDSVNMTMTQTNLTAFYINNCKDLITYGPTVWWDVPGFSQATITKVEPSSNGYTITFHMDDGYDPSFLFESPLQLNAEYTNPKTFRLQAGPGWSTFSGPVNQIGNDNSTYTYEYTNGYFTPQAGFKLLARGDFIQCNQVSGSTNTTIVDFTIWNCAGFNWLSTGNHKSTFRSVSIVPAPFPPPGGTELPARSSSADGIHSAGDFIGPTWDSCLFTGLDDDCMAAHGELENCTGPGDNGINSFRGTAGAYHGDLLRFYSAITSEVFGTAIVTSNTSDINGVQSITVNSLPSGVVADLPNARYANQNMIGSGYEVINCHTTGNRGRGAILQASDGYIANNLFEGVSYEALWLGQQFSDIWPQADYAHNLHIVNNTANTCNYLSKAGAVVGLYGAGYDPINGNSNVTIDGLKIINTTACNLYVGAATGVSLSNVAFVDSYRSNYSLWESYPGALVSFANVSLHSVSDFHVIGGIGKPGVNLTNLAGTVLGWDSKAFSSVSSS